MSSPFGLVIFDCDGVLVDSETIDDEVVASLLQGAGFPIQPHDVNRLSRGRSDADMWRIIEREYGMPVLQGILDGYHNAIYEALRSRVRPIEGAPEIVAALTTLGFLSASHRAACTPRWT